jgi:hypothetical protein
VSLPPVELVVVVSPPPPLVVVASVDAAGESGTHFWVGASQRYPDAHGQAFPSSGASARKHAGMRMNTPRSRGDARIFAVIVSAKREKLA